MANRFKGYGTRYLALAVGAAVLGLSLPGLQTRSWPQTQAMLADDLDPESLRISLERSLQYLKRLPPERVVGEVPRPFTAREVMETLVAFGKLLDRWDCRECWKREISAKFELIPSSADPGSAAVLFTGYYQPVLEASLLPTAEYVYPIYGKPADLIVAEQVTLVPNPASRKVIGRMQAQSLVPYYSRREIDEVGSLRGKGYEIAWLKDPIDVFFLHIQGSGILRLADGRRLNVGYAAGNGRGYRSIAKLLIDDGKIAKEEMSMQRLRRYLADHPNEKNEILSHNESYVFFRFVEQGPLGYLDIPLTPGRSIAADASLFPKGALAFITSERPIVDPAGELAGWQPFSRFVLNQDTGAAIRGSQRVDIYFGSGAEAGAAAGLMNRPGRLYFLVLKKRADGPRKGD